MTRVDDEFVINVVRNAIDKNGKNEAQEIIQGFWGFVEVTDAPIQGTVHSRNTLEASGFKLK